MRKLIKLTAFLLAAAIIIGIITALVPSATLALLSLIFSLYVFLNALVKFIDFASAVKNGVPDAFFDFFAGIFFTVFGVIMLFGTLMGGYGMLIVIGLYCILYGVGELRLFLREAMIAHVFQPFECEWWHFTLKDEPFPDTSFTFPVSRCSVSPCLH